MKKRILSISLIFPIILSLLYITDNSMEVYAAEEITVAEDLTSSYVPTSIINGSFEQDPWIDFTYNGTRYTASNKYSGTINNITSVATVHYNGVNKGWNTTEIKYLESSLFERSGSPTTYGITGIADGSYFIEENYCNAAALYQDLSTNPGDVIIWSLSHAARTNAGDNNQSIEVEIGASDGNLPLGVNENINTHIEATSMATYTASGVTGTYGKANTSDLEGLTRPKSSGAWVTCKGVYIIPENQTTTRFAFVSTSASVPGCGNMLDNIHFDTLIGNLKAAAQADGSVKVTGYWGDTDTSKKLDIKIGESVQQISMTSVSKKNFAITIPASIIGEASSIEIYHQDYADAKKTINIQFKHKWKYTITTENNVATLTAKCVASAHSAKSCYSSNASVSLEASNVYYSNTPVLKTAVIESMNFDAINSYFDKTLSTTNIKFYPIDEDGQITGQASDTVTGSGKYIAILSELNATDLYLVYDEEDLKSIGDKAYSVLMNDITLTANNWTQISLSSGCTFNGQGHTINMGTQSNGIFSTSSGTIKNLNLSGNLTNAKSFLVDQMNVGLIENITVTGSMTGSSELSNVASIAGEIPDTSNSCTIQNCINKASINNINAGNMGGICGLSSNTSATIKNCVNTGKISGKYFIGGIVGKNSSVISNSYNYGEIEAVGLTSHDSGAGGITGLTNGNITSCYNANAITGKRCVAGISGLVLNCTIDDCHNTGSVKATGNESKYYCGGLSGYNTNVTFKNCTASGEITPTATDNYDQTGNIGYYSGNLGSSTFTNCSTNAVSKAQNFAIFECESDNSEIPLLVQTFESTKLYSVAFNANGGYGTMSSVNVEKGQYTLPTCSFKPAMNKEFESWALSALGANISTTTTYVADDITLYAKWKEHTHRIITLEISDGITKQSCDCGFYVIKFD